MNSNLNEANETTITVHFSTLLEHLDSLEIKNNILINCCQPFNSIFKSRSISLFILNTSEKLKLNNEAKYLALELFAKFMNVHIKEVEEIIIKNPNRKMNDIFSKIKSQVVLRSLSCIQLANKISSNITINCTQLKEILEDLGYNYSLSSILSSELRVFRYLDYKLLIPTPYAFLNTLSEVLTRTVKEIDSKYLYSANLMILETYYCMREKIFDKLYETLTGRTRDANNCNLGILENDFMYLASSIIIASCHIKYASKKQLSDLIINEIARISKIDKEDLIDFAEILCEFSMFGESKK